MPARAVRAAPAGGPGGESRGGCSRGRGCPAVARSRRATRERARPAWARGGRRAGVIGPRGAAGGWSRL